MTTKQINREIKIMLKDLNSKKDQVRGGIYDVCSTGCNGRRIVLGVANGGEINISERGSTAKEIHGQLSAILNVLNN
jgi:hypothetical protein